MLILLNNANRILQVITASGGADIEISGSYMEADTSVPPVIQDIGEIIKASVTTAVTTDVLAGAASKKRNVRELVIRNNHASASETVTVQITDGTNIDTKAKAILLFGEVLLLTEGGVWIHYDANMGMYPQVGAIADQTTMEAGTSLVNSVAPGRLQYHPAAVKAWGRFTVSGTTTFGYNVDAPTDNGTGDITVNFTADFSGANNYEAQVQVEMTSTTYSVANARDAHIRLGGLAAGSVRCDCIDATVITQLVKDPTSWHVSACGDL